MNEQEQQPKLPLSASAQEILLAEYKANVELWIHDDMLRQSRNSNFLKVNTVLLAGLGVVASLKADIRYLGGIGLLFAVFGLILSKVWHKVQLRNAEYIRFRRFQLPEIEAKLGGADTFRNTFTAFYEQRTVEFHATEKTFEIKEKASGASTLSENHLPVLIAYFWTLVAIVAALPLAQAACQIVKARWPW